MAILTSVKKNGQKKGGSFTQQEVAEIQELAYQFFEERDYQHGHHEEDWLRAEAIVRDKRS